MSNSTKTIEEIKSKSRKQIDFHRYWAIETSIRSLKLVEINSELNNRDRNSKLCAKRWSGTADGGNANNQQHPNRKVPVRSRTHHGHFRFAVRACKTFELFLKFIRIKFWNVFGKTGQFYIWGRFDQKEEFVDWWLLNRLVVHIVM